MTDACGSDIGRREAVRTVLGAVAALALGGCASLATRRVTPIDGRVELALAHYPELNETGGSLTVQADGEPQPIYVLRLDDGRFVALSPICTHLGCTVQIDGARLACPCHGSMYDRAGNVVRGPAERPLRRYPTELTRDGVLLIALGGGTP